MLRASGLAAWTDIPSRKNPNHVSGQVLDHTFQPSLIKVSVILVSGKLPVQWVTRTGTLLTSLKASSRCLAPGTGPWRIHLLPVPAPVTEKRRCCRTVLQEPEDFPPLRSGHPRHSRIVFSNTVCKGVVPPFRV